MVWVGRRVPSRPSNAIPFSQKLRPDAAVDVAFFSPHKLLGLGEGSLEFLGVKLCKAGFGVVGFFVGYICQKKRHPQMVLFGKGGGFFIFFSGKKWTRNWNRHPPQKEDVCCLVRCSFSRNDVPVAVLVCLCVSGEA